jgi:hypothetical protein
MKHPKDHIVARFTIAKREGLATRPYQTARLGIPRRHVGRFVGAQHATAGREIREGEGTVPVGQNRRNRARGTLQTHTHTSQGRSCVCIDDATPERCSADLDHGRTVPRRLLHLDRYALVLDGLARRPNDSQQQSECA